MEVEYMESIDGQITVIHTIQNHKRFGNMNLKTREVEYCGEIYATLYEFIACHYMKYPYLVSEKDKWL